MAPARGGCAKLRHVTCFTVIVLAASLRLLQAFVTTGPFIVPRQRPSFYTGIGHDRSSISRDASSSVRNSAALLSTVFAAGFVASACLRTSKDMQKRVAMKWYGGDKPADDEEDMCQGLPVTEGAGPDAAYRMGDVAEVLRSDSSWSPCRVKEVREDGCIIVAFDDAKKSISPNRRMKYLRSAKKVEFSHVVREWRMKYAGPFDISGPKQGGAEMANGLLDKLLPQIKTVPGVVSVERLVCGGCLDFKVRIKVEGSRFVEWEAAGHPPEREFIAACEGMPELSVFETQTITSETL